LLHQEEPAMNAPSMMSGMGWPGLVLLLVLWGGALALVLWGCSNRFPAGAPTTKDEAITILRQRYATGEISHAEFLQASASLQPYRQPSSRMVRHSPRMRRIAATVPSGVPINYEESDEPT
jgi:hypothetical protein